MRSDKETFEAALEVGTKAEDIVYAWLKSIYSYVQDTRYQTRKEGTGPRLEGTSGSVILPDFIIYDRFKGKHAVDVKAKTSAYFIEGGRYFTVDSYKFDHYMKTVELMGLDGLYIIFVFEDELYLYTHEDMVRRHSFANSYGKVACLFDYDKTKIRR